VWRPNARVAAALLVALLVCAAATWPSLAGTLVLKYWAPREVPALPTGNRTFAPTPSAPRRTPLDEMERRLGFQLLQPTYLPAGCSLHEHWVEPAMVANLTYYWAETFSGGKAVGPDAPRPPTGACVMIAERADQRVQMPRVGPNSVEEVQVAGEPALYVRGAWTSFGRGGEPFWDPTAGPTLFFERGDRMVMLNGAPGTSREEMIKIAESMR
jgi:hypothetical protein